MNRRSLIRGIPIIVGITLITFAYITYNSVRSQEESLSVAFSNLHPLWLVLAAILALQEGVCGGLRIWVVGRVLYPQLKLRSAIISEFVLMFCAGVTPGQIGAAPSQMAVLMTGGMKFAEIATAELLVTSCTVVFFMTTAITVFVMRSMGWMSVPWIDDHPWAMAVGTIGFTALLIWMATSAFYPPLVKGFVRLGSAVLSPVWRWTLKLLAKPARTKAWAAKMMENEGSLMHRAMLTVDEFHAGFLIYAKKGKAAYLAALLLTFGFFCSRFAVAYFILRGLGLPTTPSSFVSVGPAMFQIILIQALLNFVIYMAPIPGAGGFAELSSQKLMSPWVRGPYEVPYVVLWRLLTLFLCMFVGGLYVFRFLGADVLEKRTKEIEAEKRAGPSSKGPNSSAPANTPA